MLTIENIVNGNQMYIAVPVNDIQFPYILVNNPHLVFKCLLVMVPFPEQKREEIHGKITPDDKKQHY